MMKAPLRGAFFRVVARLHRGQRFFSCLMRVKIEERLPLTVRNW